MIKVIIFDGKPVLIASPKSKISRVDQERLQAMYAAYSSGETCIAIGRRYNLSAQRVHRILQKHFGVSGRVRRTKKKDKGIET